MAGKKIDRKKQSLLSRSATRKATIKKLTHKPVIKNVDIEAIKESFKKLSKADPKPAIAAEVIKNPTGHAEPEIAKTTRKHKKDA